MKTVIQDEKNKIFFICLFTLLVLSAEIGLYLRNYLNDRRPQSANSTSKILVYGDSILSLPIKYISHSLSNKNISIVDLTELATRTEKVEQRLLSDIDTYKPSLILLMIGKSDLESREGLMMTEINFFLRNSRVLSFFIETIKKYRDQWMNTYQAIAHFSISLDWTNESCTLRQISMNPNLCLHYIRKLSEIGKTESALRLIDQVFSHTQLDQKIKWRFQARKASFLAKIGKDKEALENLVSIDKNFLTTDHRLAGDYLKTLLWLKLSRKVIATTQSLPLSFQKKSEILIPYSWATHMIEGCSRSISLFEESMMLEFITRNQLSELTKCYFQTNKVQHGLQTIKKLSQTIKLPEEISISIARFFLSLGQTKEAHELLEKFKKDHPQDRDVYKGQLALYALADNDELLNETFREQPIVQSRKSAIAAFSSYRKILTFAQKKGVKVLAIQYPNEREEILELELGTSAAKIISTRKSLLEAMNKIRLKEMFQIDFEHLSEKGACVVGQDIALYILKELSISPNLEIIKDCARL